MEQDLHIPDEANGPESGAARKNRGIRFSNAEWRQIEQLALEPSVTASELVRQTMVSLINRRLPAWCDGAAPTLPPGIQTQIEQIYRGVYMLATLKRDKLYERCMYLLTSDAYYSLRIPLSKNSKNLFHEPLK